MYPSSDDFVFDQIFIQHEYGALCDAVKSADFIMDLGANVGYASALFASRYPSSRIVAVEPDPGNYKECTENLAPYGARVQALKGAVWARRSKLALARGGCDGRDWAVQVRESSGGDANVDAWDMPALLELSGQRYVDILKIDIEGSEAEVFAANTEEWLPRVRNICIELHGERCREIFFSALSGFEYELQNQGEFTLCLNLRPRIEG
jgi:FkbM family methyltransferase